MPRRTGLRWPAGEGCDCRTCGDMRAARTLTEAAEAVRRRFPRVTIGAGDHFQIDADPATGGAPFTAHAIDHGGFLSGCWCAACVPTLPSDPAPPTYSGDQAPPGGSTRAIPEPAPEPTPDPLAQVTCEEPTEEEPATVACHYCGDECAEGDVRYFGFRVSCACCPSCRFECDRCGDEALQEDGRSVAVPQGYSQDWCEGCWRDHSWYCTECEAAFSDAVSPRYAEDDDDHDYPRCPGCHRREEARREPVVFGMGPYHDPVRRDQTRLINSPWTTAHGGRRFGVELEVERSSVATRSAEALADALLVAAHAVQPWAGQGHRLMWAERDGSLNDGAELISAPAGLDVQRDLWRAVLACPEVRQLRSHDTSTCGLHVHVQRPGAWLTAKAAQWLALPTTEELVRLVARRYNTTYCRMESRTLSRRTVHGWSRYDALNTTNSGTIEFRIFRGTLRPESVLAAVEFAHAVLVYVEDTSAPELAAADTSARFIRRIHAPDLRADTRHLRAMITSRADRAPAIAQALAELPRKKTPAAPLACVTTETED